jgi:arylsulfatase A-like enzyme
VALFLLSAVVGFATEDKAPARSPAGRPPNVLFIAVDDLNDWVGALGGHPDAMTPNLDRLAARGLLFTRAYCAAPACNPSRTSVLCGVQPATSGVYHNADPWRKALPHAVTLPQAFKAAGYHVAGGGKIFHGGFEDPDSWHEYFKKPADPRPQAKPANSRPQRQEANEDAGELPANDGRLKWGPLDGPESAMPDYKLTEWAAEFLGRKHEKPFFLAVGLYRPHLPWRVPRKYFDILLPHKVRLPAVKDDDLADVPAAGRAMARPEGDHKRIVASGSWASAVAAYLASVAFADAMLGRLIDALDKSPHAADTVVVLWGDHGWHLGEKQHWRKFALWEEATRVPLVVIAPGVTRPGGRCERTVSLLDLYPTLCELCGVKSPAGLEGRSLAPLLRDPSASWNRPAVTTHGRSNHALRSERWRYIRYADGSEELYDHSADPLEWTNLAAKPESAAELKGLRLKLEAWLPREEAPPPARAPRSRQRSSPRRRARGPRRRT